MTDPNSAPPGRHEPGQPHPYVTPPVPQVPPQWSPPVTAYGTNPPAPATPARWNRALLVPWVLVGVLSIALVVTVALLLLPSKHTPAAAKKPATHDVAVNFTLTDADTAGAGCLGQSGYSDIGAGTPVTIKSGSGEILGAGSLGTGNATGDTCTWTVTIAGVRMGQSFYSAEVGGRGAITSSAGELASNNYSFDLSLGH